MLFSIDVALVSGKCQSDHQSLLLELKNSLIFDESISTILVTWNSTTDCCEWRGISCDVGGLGHVTGLDLSCESISGGLDNSSNLFDLQSLQSLDLSLNDFNITLPTRFANLTNLVSLNLHAAGFKDQIPSEISKLTKLVSLRLSSVYDVPMKLEKPNLATLVQNLTELTELYLDGVNISASGREWCEALSSSLPNLKVLSLSNCFLSGPIDASLAKLQSLSIIDLSGNNLSAPVPEFFANYSKLIALQLPSCELKGILPQTIFQVPTLEIIDLSSNMLTGSIPSFSTSKKLTYVDLYLNQLTGEVPSSHWEGLLNLAFVDLGHNALSGSIPLSLFAIPSLQTMQLSNNRFWGQVPEFPNVSSSLLHTLDLSSNKLEGPIPSSVFGLAKLNVLKLSSNKLNGTMQLHWIHRLRNLTSLDLSYNNLTVNAAGSNSTASSLPQIRDLRLASCNLRMFPDLSNQSKLFHLDLSDNQITGLLPGWISAFNILQYLNLSSNLLVGLEKPLSLPSLLTIDLHSNQLQGSIPVPPSFIVFVDYSSNNFTSSIPHNIEIKWNLISAELGYVFGLGIIILPLMFCKRWRIRSSIISQMEFENKERAMEGHQGHQVAVRCEEI
ncbi:unnamed protein product [Dovyalis caffra]|uniref:Leucine-rich repeat-containing N-terminal plant-type domain-containing protein n=1 Tax=Dovyalis caffra TaxID=77055 RepID=A0AAV1S0D9_9ROSI|nr:unnamed protein product [Dovyalis caffra]